MYGDQLTAGRKLGRHLPRIASGDAEDHLEDFKAEERQTHTENGLRQTRDWEIPDPRMRDLIGPGTSGADDVVGVPGRLRFSKDKAPTTPTSPLPSARPAARGGLWADTQRHLLLAYEYLCHVGEAQQWIEGCLGEELGFGVVEMEERLRNGVVLAKLVRKFQGPSVVKRIYEVSKGRCLFVPWMTCLVAC
jgi:Ras GTPase-activating-like protein IQGAP2/3